MYTPINIRVLSIVRFRKTTKIWSNESVDANKSISLVPHSANPSVVLCLGTAFGGR